MKARQLMLTGAASLITTLLTVSSGAIAVPAQTALEAMDSVTTLADSRSTAQNQSSTLASGDFTRAEAPTTGAVRIITEGGHRYLEIDTAFSTSNMGPDLHVLLDTAATPPANYSEAESGRYVNLGKLKSYTGAQRYPVPDAIDLDSFRSVVIWCRMANATFGYAPLTSTR